MFVSVQFILVASLLKNSKPFFYRMIVSHSEQITRAWYEASMLLPQTHYPGWYTKVMVSWLNISTKNAGAPVNPREAKSSTKT